MMVGEAVRREWAGYEVNGRQDMEGCHRLEVEGEKQRRENLRRWIWEVQEKAPCYRVSEVEKEKLTESIKWPVDAQGKKFPDVAS